MKKIAVTYDNGKVYQHFGMALNVKIYEVEDGKIVSTEIIEMKAAGHSMIAVVLFTNNVNVLICGNIKPGAAEGIAISGIELFAGVEGDADAAVEAYINGTLKHNPDALTVNETCGHDGDDDHVH